MDQSVQRADRHVSATARPTSPRALHPLPRMGRSDSQVAPRARRTEYALDGVHCPLVPSGAPAAAASQPTVALWDSGRFSHRGATTKRRGMSSAGEEGSRGSWSSTLSMELSSPVGHTSWQASNPNLANNPRWTRTCVWKDSCADQFDVCEDDLPVPLPAPLPPSLQCASWCARPCSELNGNYEIECAGCLIGEAGCNPATLPRANGAQRERVQTTSLGDTRQLSNEPGHADVLTPL
jgi:hypothetical protein